MQNVRQRILQILQERGRATVADLAEALNMAPVSVRHHLDILQGDGLIRVDGVRRRRGAGRPQHVYALTPEAVLVFPKNYEEVLHYLLETLEQDLSPQQMDALVCHIARRIASQFRVAPGSEEERFDRAVAFLNERGYMARWEQDEDGVMLLLVNCPYAGLIGEHEQLCRLDAVLLQHLLNREEEPLVESTIREGAYQCRFRVPVAQPVVS